MKRNAALTWLLVLLLLPGIFGCQMKTNGIKVGNPVPGKELSRTDGLTPAVLKSQDDKIAYSIGLDAGADLQKLELNVNSSHHLLQGVKDSFLGNEPLLTVEERQQVLSAFFAERAAPRSKESGPQAEKNLADGKQSESAKTEEVKTPPSSPSTAIGHKQLSRNDGLTPAVLKSLDDKIAYSIGLAAGTDLQGLELNVNSILHLLQGIKDSLLGNEPLLTVEERQQVQGTFLGEGAATTRGTH